MKNVAFKLDGMHCGGCAATIQAVLERSVGVRKASASFEDREARILFDATTTSEGELASLIEKAGFRVVERRTA